MNYQEPLNINNIDLNNIVYPKSRSNQNKKIILLKYNDRGKLKNFVFQTPTLLNLYKAQELSNYSEIEVALTGKEESKISRYIHFLNKLECKIKEDAQLHAGSWFDINNETKTINFQKIIRESDDYDNGTIKLKIINNTDFQTTLKMNNNKNISIDEIQEDSWCKMLLECYAIWVNSNNDFGLFLRPVLISFTQKEIYNYNFIEDSDDEDKLNVPDTEINNNIFMKINKNSKIKYNNSTTQLEINELVKNLDKNHIETSDFNNIANDNIIKLKLDENLFHDNSSSDNSININNINNTLLNAETSDSETS
jgi:hypothetical protein